MAKAQKNVERLKREYLEKKKELKVKRKKRKYGKIYYPMIHEVNRFLFF